MLSGSRHLLEIQPHVAAKCPPRWPLALRGALGVVFLIALAALEGCKPKSPYSCVRVSGKVTYDDGSLIPVDQIRLTFLSQTQPTDLRTHPRDGVALVDVKSGNFTAAATYSRNDGIIAGKHKVLVEAFTGRRLRTDLVPQAYSSPQDTPVTVDTGQSPFDIKVRKRKPK